MAPPALAPSAKSPMEPIPFSTKHRNIDSVLPIPGSLYFKVEFFYPINNQEKTISTHQEKYSRHDGFKKKLLTLNILLIGRTGLSGPHQTPPTLATPARSRRL
jgi:hypothetical protein